MARLSLHRRLWIRDYKRRVAWPRETKLGVRKPVVVKHTGTFIRLGDSSQLLYSPWMVRGFVPAFICLGCMVRGFVSAFIRWMIGLVGLGSVLY